MTDRLRELVQGALRTGTFTLASGKTSNFYFDGKQVTLDQEGALLVGEAIADLLADDPPEALGGPALGACPMVTAAGLMTHQRKLPLKLFYVRAATKDHGTGRRIEGPPLGEGTRVVLVEDTITTGTSLLSAVEAVRESGLVVDTVICLVDREEGGAENLLRHGLTLRAIFTRSQLL